MRRIHAWSRSGLALAVALLLGAPCLAQPEIGAAELPEVAPAPDAGPEGADANPAEPGATDLETAPTPTESPPISPPGASRRTAIEQAWLAPATSFQERVVRIRRVALEQGAWNLGSAARGMQLGGADGTPLERALAAVELAPDLPAAHMWLARALWLHGDSPMAAVRAVVSALQAIGRHTEASFWFAGSGFQILAVALVGGGLLAILLYGIASLPHAAHDVGHRFSSAIPEFARFAALASLLLLPVAFGEGVLGLALGLLVVAVVYGSVAQRIAMGLAVALVVLGAFPVARMAGLGLSAFPADPVARAAYSAAQGLATPVDLARLEAAADQDPLAARGLAIHARRTGNLGKAATLYQRLLADSPDDLAVINNAANVRLDLGHMDKALELYGRAALIEESPIVLFNLAQAYGRAFQVEDLNRTLAHAQGIDGDLVARLTALQGAETRGFVVDFPLSGALIWPRALGRTAGDELAAEFRESFAPGRLGADGVLTAGVTGVVFGLAALAASRVSPSRRCRRCGNRMCPRCDPDHAGGEICGSCTRLFYQPEKTDRTLRLERMNELRQREQRINGMATAVSVLVPGAAGLLADRPLRSVLGALCFTLAVYAIAFRDGIVPDPLVAGAAAPFAFFGVALLAALGYVALVATSLATRRNR